ncbi:hypothetical protein PP657_gp021 [Bacillus phage BCPST]|uniref:Uncharacterized protein n=1 Tax=Bacillus phage BCPST TaxID=2801506 RepID=A0AAE7TQL9_9CAUD|nr:hypothetical protein PP657_gp021 [Bacillus phage BCPST]QQO38639.1 hypothetical protein BCPST_021 [Bacillus phage BCPST]QSJ04229.1 hypothetical protein BCP6_024 [Bacillus phage BCP6]
MNYKFVDMEKFMDVVECEGIYYATFDYVSPETIIDPKLKELVEKANKAMDELKKYIGEE